MSSNTFVHPNPHDWSALRLLAETLRHMDVTVLAKYGMGYVFCMQEYGLRNVRLSQPTLVLVLEGHKRHSLHMASEHEGEAFVAKVTAPSLLLLPADTPLCIENIPDAESSRYLAYFLSFAPDLLERVARYWTPLPQTSEEQVVARAFAPAPVVPDASLLTMLQLLLRTTLEQLQGGPACPQLVQLQCEQIALVLFLRGFDSHLLLRRDTLVDEAMHLIQQQPHLHWTLENLAQELRCGSRTLRRRLQQEGRTLREVLRHIRLHTALGMLQQQRCTVSEAAFSCGYDSPSRFSQRFQEHFGLLPSALLRSGRTDMASTGVRLA